MASCGQIQVRYHVAEGYTRFGSGLYISEVHMNGRTLELLRLPRICESITRAQCGLVLLSFG
jgi:Tfp pilus assembly ATPase PilU